MRQIAALLMTAVLLLTLSPCAFAAEELLARPGEGQIVFVDADNSVDYCVDFPLPALKSASRSGDDLLLQLPASRLVLRGFFTNLGDWRSIDFSDGKSLGGGDFDEKGRCTADFSTAGQFEKKGSLVSRAGTVLNVVFSQYGTNVLEGEVAVEMPLRQLCLETAGQIMPVEKPDWSRVHRLRFDITYETDGGLRPSGAEAVFNDGITVKSMNPSVVYISDSLSLVPLSPGRDTVSYENDLGQELFRLDIRCELDEDGQLSIGSSCPGCTLTQGGQLHYRLCGHYSCQDSYSAAEHSPAQCGVAGHCSSEGDHTKCKNCLEPMCNGQNHGLGLCLHAHTWMQISLYSSRCIVCSAEYTRPA